MLKGRFLATGSNCALLSVCVGKGGNGTWLLQNSKVDGRCNESDRTLHVFEARITKKVVADDMQFAFRLGKGTTDTIFVVMQT